MSSLIEKTKILINKIDTPVWLEVFFPILLLLRIPSFFEPYYYGDEMIYLTLGEGLRKGIPLYLGLHDNKPPLLYLTAAIAGNLFIFKVILAIWNLITVYGFWKLVKTIYPKNFKLHKISTIIFGLLTTLPLFEGNTANAELFMIGPVIFAFWIILSKKSNFKNIFVSGVLISVAALFKIPAAFDILGVILFWITQTKKGEFLSLFKKIIFISVGFLTPILLTFVWYLFAGGIKEYFVAAFLQNLGYVSSWRPKTEDVGFLVKNGPLLIRAMIMFLGFATLFLLRKRLSAKFIFVSSWLIATLFAVTLSERPYPHYFVQSLAPISILIGSLVTLGNIEQVLSLIPLSLAFFVPFYYKFWYYPTFSYYQRFINFSFKNISKDQYFNSFSPNVVRNYKIADFLVKSSKKDENVFVWSNDSATIYALSRRLPSTKYVADYHFIDFSTKEKTLESLREKPPKFIVTTQNSYPFNELNGFVSQYYYIIAEIDDARIWLRIAK